jgi:hypothetical protein
MSTLYNQVDSCKHILVDASPIDIDAKVIEATRMYLDAGKELFSLASKTAHIHPAWCHHEFLGHAPFNNHLFTYMVLKKVAEDVGAPLSWLYLLDFSIQVDPAQARVVFEDTEVKMLDEEGYASPLAKAAWYDAKEAGLIDEEEFLFSLPPGLEKSVAAAKEFIQSHADENNMSFEKALGEFAMTNIDAPFPHENDDSHGGDEE